MLSVPQLRHGWHVRRVVFERQRLRDRQLLHRHELRDQEGQRRRVRREQRMHEQLLCRRRVLQQRVHLAVSGVQRQRLGRYV